MVPTHRAPLTLGALAALLLMSAGPVQGQHASARATASVVPSVDPSLYDGMRWRMVGPHRGGRVTAVAGIPGRLHTFL